MKFLTGLSITLFTLSIFYVFYAASATHGVGIGAWFPLVFLGSFAVVMVFRKGLRKLFRKAYKPLMVIYWACFSLYTVSFAVFLGAILTYTAEDLPPSVDAVIVLGCRAAGSVPGAALQSRCDEAYAVLQNYPDAYCITSGGIDTGNTISEAYIMKEYLVGRGIDPARILTEDAATSTESNLRLSIALAKAEGLELSTVILATNDFHAPRAVMLTQNKGLTAYVATSPGPRSLVVPNIIREYFALAKSIVFDLNKG